MHHQTSIFMKTCMKLREGKLRIKFYFFDLIYKKGKNDFMIVFRVDVCNKLNIFETFTKKTKNKEKIMKKIIFNYFSNNSQ